MQSQYYYIYKLPQEYIFGFGLLLLISTIVIADPNSQIDLPDEFNNLNVDEIFSREKKLRQQKKEEIEWRAPVKETHKTEVRWGAKSIYEDNDQLDPFIPSPGGQEEIIRSKEATPQLEIRF